MSFSNVWEPASDAVPAVRAQTFLVEETQYASAGQTVFTLTQFTYVPGSGTLRVYINGSRITDVIENATNAFTLPAGCACNADDKVFIEALLEEVSAATSMMEHTQLIATEGQTVFTVNNIPAKSMIFRNGASLAYMADYSSTGLAISLVDSCAAGDVIDVYAFATMKLVDTVASADLANQTDPLKGAGIVGFDEELDYLSGTVGRALSFIAQRDGDVRKFGAHKITEAGYENFDSAAAFNAALATGRPVRFSGAYNIGSTLRQPSGVDFILIGDDACYVSDGNESAFDTSIGSTLIYTGVTTDKLINPSNDIGTGSIQLKNFRVIANPDAYNVIDFDATEYNTITGASGTSVQMDNVALLVTDSNQSDGGWANYAITINVDNNGAADRARFAFGWSINNVYLFNFNTGLSLKSPEGYINGNTFSNIKMYQVYRPLHAIAGDGANSIYQNNFVNLQVQPGRLNTAGVYTFANGLLLYDRNFSANVFENLCLYDVDATGVSIVHTNAPGGVSNNLYLGAGDIPGGTVNIHNGLPGYFIRQDGNHKVKSLQVVEYGNTPDGVMFAAKNNGWSLTSVPEGAGTRVVIKMDGTELFSVGPAGLLRVKYAPALANNAAALSAGLLVGDVYRVNGTDYMGIVH